MPRLDRDKYSDGLTVSVHKSIKKSIKCLTIEIDFTFIFMSDL